MRQAALVSTIGLSLLAISPTAAQAWGYEGHQIVATLAESYLTPTSKAKVDALLASDPDTLTAPDMASRATWADAWRSSHRETSQWHFVDIELDHPDLKAACFGFPASAHPASAGPEQACLVSRIEDFARELADPSTPQPEEVLALKYLLHFVGDLHQPLHAADNHDRGGNCVLLSLGGPRTTNLHSYWDTGVMAGLGPDAPSIARRLRSQIKPGEAAAWRKGDVRSWAMESYQVAKATVYWSGARPGCDRDAAPVNLPNGYESRATKAAELQLQRAGVRLALVLNRALDPRR